MQGRAVSKQILRNQPAGQGIYQLNGAGLSPGMYMVTLENRRTGNSEKDGDANDKGRLVNWYIRSMKTT